MFRAIVVFLILAAIAGVGMWWWNGQQQAMRERQDHQIGDLQTQLAKLRADNDRLKSELNKVEEEENRLATENRELTKALEQAKVTGKVATLPYPPK
jgi:uncharacterized protein HemX